MRSRHVKWLLAAGIVPPALYLLLAVLLALVPTSPEPISCASRQQVYIASNGLHLNIMVSAERVGGEALRALGIPRRARFVGFGWGDRRFYLETPTWRDLSPGAVVQALFWRSETAMHVDYFTRPADSWQRLPLCDRQLQALMAYILKSFERDSRGQYIRIDAPGYYGTDAFYEAVGSYTLFRTCNNWVNIALKRAGVRTALWSPFDLGVLYHVRQASSG